MSEARIEPGPSEESSLRAADEFVERRRSVSLVDDRTGERTPLSPSAVHAVHLAVHTLGEGKSVVVLGADQDITPNEAAALLNVSRPFVLDLVAKGELEAHDVGTHHRLPLTSVLAYKRRRSSTRRDALRNIARTSKKMGLYDNE